MPFGTEVLAFAFFVVSSFTSSGTRRGEDVLELRAASEETLQNLVETGTEARMWDLGAARIRFRRIYSYRVVSWAPVTELHVMYAVGVKEERDMECDWELFERKRLCWRSVPELQKVLSFKGPIA
jgi:hypothetical protein